MGQATFFKGCTAYFEKYAFSNTTLEDFFGCLQVEVKDLDLMEFSKKWLMTKGCNTYEVIDSNLESITIRQGFAPYSDPVYRS